MKQYRKYVKSRLKKKVSHPICHSEILYKVFNMINGLETVGKNISIHFKKKRECGSVKTNQFLSSRPALNLLYAAHTSLCLMFHVAIENGVSLLWTGCYTETEE